ncbi:unnamed protein product [Clavelina lepadiformis]|uniref:Sulfotransferase n=1 Tax=Clavelina lepadiformis TaxID=159417 RepID=A0ABP0FCY1_CLALP
MKVIAAGFSKTGTKSMFLALSELGYNVYDFHDHFWHHCDQWSKIYSSSTGGTIEDFKEMYESVDAVTDAPPYLFWEEILQAFPDAKKTGDRMVSLEPDPKNQCSDHLGHRWLTCLTYKVILTTRDEEEWYQSVLGQNKVMKRNYIYQVMQILSPTGWKYYKFFRDTMTCLSGLRMRHPFDLMFVKNEMQVRKCFRQHQEYCKQNCPPEKLFAYDVRQGWAPLCKFLGKEIPDKPFPHENVAGNIVDNLMAKHPALIRIQREMKVTVALISFALIFGSYKIYKNGFVELLTNFWSSVQLK